MSKDTKKIEILADEKSCLLIEKLLKSHNINNLYSIKISNNKNSFILNDGEKKQKYALPVRVGKIIDDLLRHKHRQKLLPETLVFDGGKLKPYLGIFLNKDDQKIQLTEKEIEILAYLHANKNSIVSRESLLKGVWNYAENVETHTVETHIYRLRKKIEQDPAKPEIVITKNDGYMIKEE